MRGRFCTQPFLVEKQTRYPLSPRRFPSPAPLGESIAPSSAPVCALGHLCQCAHWGTYGLWWLRLDLTEQSPGLFDPQGEGFGGGKDPSRLRNPPFPARPAGGRAVTGVGSWAAGQAEKREDHRRVPQTRKGGSREEEPLPPWCSFLRLSSKESRAPPRSSAGNPRCRVHPATVPTELPTDDRGPLAPLGSLRPSAQREMGTKPPRPVGVWGA